MFMNYSIENLKIVTSPYYRAYLPDGRNTYMPVVFCDEYFVDLYLNPDNFMISNYGRMYSKSRKMMMSFKSGARGYYYDIMLPDKTRMNVLVDSIVAHTFVPNIDPSKNTFILHKDGNIHNNYYMNLQWIDPNNIPKPDYTYDRSEAVKHVCPMEPPVFDYTQFKYITGKSITSKGFPVYFADELFKEISVRPNYVASNYGRIYSKKTGFILTPTEDKDGYLRVGIDNTTSIGIHRLVAFAFFDPSTPHYGDQVNHKDGNKKNNHVSNLEWCNCIENIRHAMRIGLRDNTGEKMWCATYSNEDIENQCKLLEQGYSAPEIAGMLGIPYSDNFSNHIGKIRRKEKWTFISDKYNIPRYSKNSYKYKK